MKNSIDPLTDNEVKKLRATLKAEGRVIEDKGYRWVIEKLKEHFPPDIHLNKKPPSDSQMRFIENLQYKLNGMRFAHKLITEFENSAVDHYQREVDLLDKRISTLIAELRPQN